MMRLLIDFGASRVKAAICTDQNEITEIKSYSAAEPHFDKNRHCEVKLSEINAIFQKTLDDYASFDYEEIFISSEMHGFIITDKNNRPLSNYISWKDERSLNAFADSTYYNYLKEKLGDRFRQITGMKPRECFPIFNLFAELQSNQPQQDIKIISLPDFLSNISGKSQNICHATMAAGMGFYDIFKHEYSQDLILEAINGFDYQLSFNNVCQEIEIAGFYNKTGKQIPIFCGVGDHQCAVFGAGNDEQSISFNLGTGSQISIVAQIAQSETDVRPFFEGQYLHTVTHIPSGRAFLEYIGFIEALSQNKTVWDKFNTLSLPEVEASSLKFDLAIFGSAANFNDYRGISHITEKSLNLENYLASLLKSYAEQYPEILKKFAINNKVCKIILSGGIAHKIPALKDYFNKYTPYQTEVSTSLEETLSGLARLSLQAVRRG